MKNYSFHTNAGWLTAFASMALLLLSVEGAWANVFDCPHGVTDGATGKCRVCVPPCKHGKQNRQTVCTQCRDEEDAERKRKQKLEEEEANRKREAAARDDYWERSRREAEAESRRSAAEREAYWARRRAESNAKRARDEADQESADRIRKDVNHISEQGDIMRNNLDDIARQIDPDRARAVADQLEERAKAIAEQADQQERAGNSHTASQMRRAASEMRDQAHLGRQAASRAESYKFNEDLNRIWNSPSQISSPSDGWDRPPRWDDSNRLGAPIVGPEDGFDGLKTGAEEYWERGGGPKLTPRQQANRETMQSVGRAADRVREYVDRADRGAESVKPMAEITRQGILGPIYRPINHLLNHPNAAVTGSASVSSGGRSVPIARSYTPSMDPTVFDRLDRPASPVVAKPPNVDVSLDDILRKLDEAKTPKVDQPQPKQTGPDPFDDLLKAIDRVK